MFCRGQTLIFALTLSACATDGEEVVELGTLEYFDYPARIEVPATAAVGESVRILVMTYGNGCNSFERTDLEATATGADVRPFDRRYIPGGDGKCTSILRSIPHEAFVSFDTAGTKRLTVMGRQYSGHSYGEISIDVSIVISN